MNRKCEICRYGISRSYILAQESFSRIRCPNCGRELEVVRASKVLTICYSFLTSLCFCMLPLGLFSTLIIEFAWIVFSYFYLPAFLYLYKEKDEDNLEE